MTPVHGPQADIPALLLQGRHSREHLLLMLDQFADQMDSRIQSTLFGALMARYADISLALESTVAKLARTDALRRDAERVALLGDWRYEKEAQSLYWSDTFYELIEFAPDVKPDVALFLERVHPDEAARVARYAQALVNGDVPHDLLYRLLMPDGRIKWVRAKHVDGATRGDPNTIYGTMQDVTREIQNELTLQRYNDDLEAMVQEKIKDIVSAQMATIYALVKLAESRDDDTGEHIERMSRYCQFVAVALQTGGPYAAQVDDAFVRDIAMASPLHDIGKVGVPDGILLKPGRLTPEEFTIMKTHVTIGYETLASFVESYPGNAYLRMGMDIARYHHEKWDGSGYQDGLAGEAIPLAARIMALCDVYDALRSRRVYKEAYTHAQSVDIISAGKGTHFDPVLADLFIQEHAAFADIYQSAKT